jgi:hypothetical protein
MYIVIFLSASVAIAATAMSAAMITKTAALRGAVPAETAVSEAAISISAAIGISATIGVSATVVFVLKTTSVKATAVEISGIPSFEKRPIVGIVSIIPIVTVPDLVVVVRISGEVCLKAYSIAVGIPIIGVGVGVLIHRSGSLVDDGRRRYIYTRATKGRPEMRVDIYLGIAPGGY